DAQVVVDEIELRGTQLREVHPIRIGDSHHAFADREFDRWLLGSHDPTVLRRGRGVRPPGDRLDHWTWARISRFPRSWTVNRCTACRRAMTVTPSGSRWTSATPRCS